MSLFFSLFHKIYSFLSFLTDKVVDVDYMLLFSLQSQSKTVKYDRTQFLKDRNITEPCKLQFKLILKKNTERAAVCETLVYMLSLYR